MARFISVSDEYEEYDVCSLINGIIIGHESESKIPGTRNTIHG